MKRDFGSTDKEELRRQMRARLQTIGAHERAEASLVICELVAKLDAFRSATCVALFAPLRSEPDIRPLVEEAWAEKKRVALPRIGSAHAKPYVTWHMVTTWSEMVETGPFGLREPDPELCKPVEPGELDCVFVPGLAFDRTGLRLGRGGGYYDCFLSALPASVPRFGLMFALQQVAEVPREPHDQALPTVITEDGLITFADPSPTAGVLSIQPPPSTSSPT